MSNNPGKKGKPAPWEKRERENRDQALEAYLREHHPAYKKWCEEKSEFARNVSLEAGTRYSWTLRYIRVEKDVQKAISAWEKQNKSPLTWEESKAMEADFSMVYVPVDRS